MKTVILAGGFGTRLSEETISKPKPMIEIGGRPILWHIMKFYGSFGFNEFLIALGYKADVVKRFFVDYGKLNGDLTVQFSENKTMINRYEHDEWTVHLRDTGYHSGTGGRLKLLEHHLSKETFMLTYGDGLSNVNIKDLLSFHKKHGKMVTLSAVRPPARFGSLSINQQGTVKQFGEKVQMMEGWINGGFMVFEPEIFNHIPSVESILETDVLEKLVKSENIMAYQHEGFWQCMDTVRDMNYLEHLWISGNAPWRLW